MKKRWSVCICLMLSLALLSGCGSESETSSDKTTVTSVSDETTEDAAKEKEEKPTEISYDNLALCSNDRIDITLKAISEDGITLNIINKSNEIITISEKGIALDGQCLPDNDNPLYWEDLVPNSTLEHQIKYNLDNVEHQTISGMFEIYSDADGDGNSTAEGDIGFSNVELGYEPHAIWVASPDAQVLYEDDQVSCSFYRVKGSRLALSISNKSTEQINCLLDSIAVNGQTITSTSSSGADILPGCEGILMVDLMDYDLESEVDNGGTISGIIGIFKDHIGTGEFSFTATI